jgi:peptide deformylase
VYLNPRIVARKGIMDGSEGCLSFPGLYAAVKRAKSVVVEAFDEAGEPVRIEATGLESRAWQHELDHLDGLVFIDRFGPLVKLARSREVKAFERSFRQQQEAGVIPPDLEIEKLLRDLEQSMGPNG